MGSESDNSEDFGQMAKGAIKSADEAEKRAAKEGITRKRKAKAETHSSSDVERSLRKETRGKKEASNKRHNALKTLELKEELEGDEKENARRKMDKNESQKRGRRGHGVRDPSRIFASKKEKDKGLPCEKANSERNNAEEMVEGKEDFVKGAEGFEDKCRRKHPKPAPDQKFGDPRPTYTMGGEDFVKEAEGFEIKCRREHWKPASEQKFNDPCVKYAHKERDESDFIPNNLNARRGGSDDEDSCPEATKIAKPVSTTKFGMVAPELKSQTKNGKNAYADSVPGNQPPFLSEHIPNMPASQLWLEPKSEGDGEMKNEAKDEIEFGAVWHKPPDIKKGQNDAHQFGVIGTP